MRPLRRLQFRRARTDLERIAVLDRALTDALQEPVKEVRMKRGIELHSKIAKLKADLIAGPPPVQRATEKLVRRLLTEMFEIPEAPNTMNTPASR